MNPAETWFPPLAMDRPVLHAFVRELLALERLQAFAAALPSRARVSSRCCRCCSRRCTSSWSGARRAPARGRGRARPGRGGGMVRRPGARRAPPSRGVRWGSGLEPPPHLVGERARALDVLADGGLVAASATALAEGVPPARTDRSRLGSRSAASRVSTVSPRSSRSPATSASSGPRSAASSPSAAASSTSSRRRAASRFASSSTATRSSRCGRSRPSPSARFTRSRARSSTRRRSGRPTCSSRRSSTTSGRARSRSRTTSCRCSTAPRLRLAARRGPPRLDGGGAVPDLARRRVELDPFPQAQPFSFEAQRPAIAARGLAEAENELNGFVRGGNRVVVAFPHAGEALRTDNLLKRAGAPRRGGSCPGSPSSCSRLRRPGAASSGASSASSCCPTRRSSASGPARRQAARPRARLLCRPPHRRLRRPRGPRRREAARLRDEGGGGRHARLPLPRLPRRGPSTSARAARQDLEVHRRRRRRADAVQLGGKAWQNLKARARESVQELATELIALYAQRQQARGRLRARARVAGAARSRVPVPRDRGPARAIESVKEDLEAPRPMDRLVCGDVGFGKTEVAVRAAFARP